MDPSSPPAWVSLPASSEHVSVEGRLWPLLVVKFGPLAQAAEFETYLEARTEWLRRQEPHVSVLDVREVHLSQVCPSLRLRYVEWLREHAAALGRWVLGSAYLMRSPEGRVMASLIRHSAGMTSPFLIAPTLPEAAAWARERLREAGLGPAATRVGAAFSLAES